MSYNIASPQLYFLCAMHFAPLLHPHFVRTIKRCSEKAKLFMKVKGQFVAHIQLKLCGSGRGGGWASCCHGLREPLLDDDDNTANFGGREHSWQRDG
jgi:hypothetical protein